MFKKILIPTDGSETAEYAAEQAIELAKGLGAKVIAVYVVDKSSFSGIPTESVWGSMKNILEDEGQKSLKSIKEMAKGAKVELEVIIKEGSPGNVIVKASKEKNVDLIVMGTTGRTGIDKFLLGSVSEKVVRHAHCPVMVVRK